MPNCIVDVTRPIQAQQDLAVSRQVRSTLLSSASPSQHLSQQSRSSSRRGHPYHDRSHNSFCLCIVCRNDNHKSFDCFTKKQVDGGDLFLLKASTSFWGDAAGRCICFWFNSAGGRECQTSPCPQGIHKCNAMWQLKPWCIKVPSGGLCQITRYSGLSLHSRVTDG
jgi:hypothetical protein